MYFEECQIWAVPCAEEELIMGTISPLVLGFAIDRAFYTIPRCPAFRLDSVPSRCCRGLTKACHVYLRGG